jgi:DNA-binding SARP family transcriptional activator
MWFGDTQVAVPGQKQRAVIAVLATTPTRTISVDTLLDAVWGEDLPDGVQHSLQQHVSALRKAIAAAGHPDANQALARKGAGYVLVASSDAEDFEAGGATVISAAKQRDWLEVTTAAAAALARWRGAAFSDARDSQLVLASAARLDALRVTVLEARFDAMLALGRTAEVLPEIREAVETHPMHEQFRCNLMLALYRSGRQADALEAFRAARHALVEELGIEPGPELRALEQAILEQRPELDVATIPAQLHADPLYSTIKNGDGDIPARLEYADGQVVFLADGTTVIGRDHDARVRLVDGRVSRRHAEIVASDGQYVLRDLGSTNGSSVNGQPVTQQPLADGDVLSIGGVQLRFVDPAP